MKRANKYVSEMSNAAYLSREISKVEADIRRFKRFGFEVGHLERYLADLRDRLHNFKGKNPIGE